jgi:hypothetical protein
MDDARHLSGDSTADRPEKLTGEVQRNFSRGFMRVTRWLAKKAKAPNAAQHTAA